MKLIYTESDGHLKSQKVEGYSLLSRQSGYQRGSQTTKRSSTTTTLSWPRAEPLLPPLKFSPLCGLAPLGPDADQRAGGTGQTDQTIVQRGDAQRGGGHAQVAQVRDELYPGSGALPNSS